MSRAGPSILTIRELQARIQSYELAARMQTTAPEAVDLKKETDATKELYGLNDEGSKSYGETLLRCETPG